MKPVLISILILQGLVCQGQVFFFNPHDGLPDSLANKNAPNFIAQTLRGNTFDLNQHHGKIVMINFWSLSCSAYFKEIVDFNKIAKETSGDDFLLISLMDNAKEELDKRITQNGKFYKLKNAVFENDLIEFEIIPSASQIMEKYRFGEFRKAFPWTFYLDENGIIRDYAIGYRQSYGVPGALTNYDNHRNKIDNLLNQRKAEN